MFLMLGIVYATMGVISALLVFQNKPINVNKKTVQNIESVTPFEVLKNKWFYQVVSLHITLLKFKVYKNFIQTWIGFFSISMCVATVATISKSFGLTFINDDHFFSHIAIFQNILNGLTRIIWGCLYDR